MALSRKSFLPDKRQSAFFIAIFFLIAIFVVGFYFFYVPANKQSVHRYAFSILENITVNMQERYNDTYRLIEGRMKSAGDDDDPKWLELRQSMQLSVSDTISPSSTPSFPFEIKINGESYFVSVPPPVMLDALFAAHREEIFESFLLLRLNKNGSEVLYADPSLYIGSDVVADTLVSADKGAMFSGIKDMHLRDLEYKMFFVPFNMNNSRLALCGFVKSSTYSSAAYQLPVAFIYVLVILLLLLLISLPLIRIYTIGRHETIRFYDLVSVVLSLFIGCTIITVIVIQVTLLRSGDITARENVENISDQIHDRFTEEIQKAYRQLDSIDRYVADRFAFADRVDSGYNASPLLYQYMAEHKKDTSLYYSFDRVSWIDRRGKQFIKAEPEKVDPVFQQVQDRKYFSAFQNNHSYPVPGMPGSAMALEGVYNWINGKFRLILSKRSRLDNAFIATLSLRSYSLMSAVLPTGYGFCVIDQAGNVQVHSTEYRNLNENLLNQVGTSDQVRGAMISRQATHLDEIDLYGRKHALHITPIAQMPYYLVTFYDKGYIVPVNMRILIFSLAFCMLFYLGIGICWLVIFYRRYYAKPMLAAPANIFSRAIPKEQNSRLYRRGTLFLFLYVVILSAMAMVSTFASLHNNYLVLVIMLLTPLNIILGLTVLIYAPYRNDKSAAHLGRRAKWGMWGLLVFFIITVLVALLSRFTGGPQLMLFQAILLSGMAWYYQRGLNEPTKEEAPGHPFRYLRRYSAFWLLLITCVAVLPAALFTWYSHNQEILQSVKKQQLHLANLLQQRKGSAGEVISVYDTSWLPPGTANSFLYKKGIYRTHTDSIVLSTKKTNAAGRKSYEEFYFEIANRISNTYYDPYSYPPLRDYSSDSSWYWTMLGDDQLSFTYTLPPDSVQSKFLQVFSTMPSRYHVMKANGKGLILAAIVLLILFGVYSIIKRLAERLFLRKYFLGTRPDCEAGFKKMIAGYQAISMADAKYIEALQKLPEEFAHPLPADDKEVYLYEQQLISAISKYNSFYSFIWRRCSDRQKYLLYQFARHGLMNGRNSTDIYALMNKGILCIDMGSEEIHLFSRSFRAFILNEMQDEKAQELQQQWKSESTWRSLRMPFLFVLMLLASFVFFTQHDAWQRIIALITGFGSIFPLLLNIFSTAGKAKAE
jgi:hypothetical protein